MIPYVPSTKDKVLGWLVLLGLIGSMLLIAWWR